MNRQPASFYQHRCSTEPLPTAAVDSNDSDVESEDEFFSTMGDSYSQFSDIIDDNLSEFEQCSHLSAQDSFQLLVHAPPVLAAKIDELIDQLFEDSLFRLVFPQPATLKSPLARFLSRRELLPLRHSLFITTGVEVSATEPFLPLQYSYLDWIRVLNEEARADLGLPPTANATSQCSTVSRAGWRLCSRFSVHFAKGIFTGCGIFLTNRFIFKLKE